LVGFARWEAPIRCTASSNSSIMSPASRAGAGAGAGAGEEAGAGAGAGTAAASACEAFAAPFRALRADNDLS